jgi:hypothetical protein
MKKDKFTVKVEKGIPLPDRTWAEKKPLIGVLEKMKDGDSFLYPLIKRSELSYCARKAGVVISTRTVDPLTIRVWRIKSSQVNGR